MTESQRIAAIALCDRILATAAKVERDFQKLREVVAEEAEKYQQKQDA